MNLLSSPYSVLTEGVCVLLMGAETTQPSLISRVRNPEDQPAWREFDRKYRDLILRYARGRGLQSADAEDVRQIVMTNLAKGLRAFAYDPAKGRFRGYLGIVVRNAVSQHFRRPGVAAKALDTAVLATTEDTDAGGPDMLWEQEWVRHHYRLAMATIRESFEPRSVDMFDRLLAGDSVDAVAKDFETTGQAVHKVKQRIRDRLKELIARQVREEDHPDG